MILLLHTLCVHYAHAAANLNSGYSKCAKVARVHYFCTIALRTSRAVLTQAWVSRRVDLFSKRVIYILLVIFKWLLNLLKCLIYHIIKDKNVCLRCAWIRLTTAYLLCGQEFRKNIALNCASISMLVRCTHPSGSLDTSKSQRMCIILSKFTRKSKYAVINL